MDINDFELKAHIEEHEDSLHNQTVIKNISTLVIRKEQNYLIEMDHKI